MSRTKRFVDPMWIGSGEKYERGSDKKPLGSKCLPRANSDKGYDSYEDDHGHYGAGGSKSCKKGASRARRTFSKNLKNKEIRDYFVNTD